MNHSIYCNQCEKPLEKQHSICPNCGKQAIADDILLPQMLSRLEVLVDESGTVSYVPYKSKVVIIPEGSVTIEGFSFSAKREKTENLEEVILPEGLKIIEKGSFFGCKKLKTVEIPKTITDVSTLAFYGCDLSELSFSLLKEESQLEASGEQAFAKSCIQTLDCPPSLEYLGYGAFAHCKELRWVNLQTKILDLPDKAFCGCENLEEISLSESLKTIGTSAFYHILDYRRLCFLTL